MRKRASLHVWLSWADLCIEARFNEAAETHTLYYSRAQHYSWPNSVSLLLWDSFCEVALCAGVRVHVSLCLWVVVGIPVWNCTERVLFLSPEGKKRLIPGMCDKSHLHPLLSSEPSFDWSGLLRTLSHITKYDTPKNVDRQIHTHTHTHMHTTLFWKSSSLFL